MAANSFQAPLGAWKISAFSATSVVKLLCINLLTRLNSLRSPQLELAGIGAQPPQVDDYYPLRCYYRSMIIFDDLSHPAHPKRPSALTIGSFDGVHKGHQHLLYQMRELVGKSGSICVVTFSNHPSHVIAAAQPIELILSREQKLRWLAAYGADIVYCVPFTQDLAAHTYQEFLEVMMQSCPFDHLVLGQDAHLGNRREGSPELVTALCNSKGVQAHYIEKVHSAEEQVSSRRIRELLALGNVAAAVELMGHPLN